MLRLLGVLLIVAALYAILMTSFRDFAATEDNHQVLARRLGYYGIFTLGVGVLIVSGGIDLSIGALAGLSAVLFGLLLRPNSSWLAAYVPGLAQGYSAPVAAGIVIVLGALVGLFHGLLVTGLRLQPFLVTLCGLFMYRGLARWVSDEKSVALPSVVGEGLRGDVAGLRTLLVSGTPLHVPNMLLLLLAIAAVLAVVLHASVLGRYLHAIGYNEQAARYAGIPTGRYKVLAYVLCSTLAALGGVLMLLENSSVLPSSSGNLLELYAITGAVLGGCSLRGGEGTIPGMLLGAAILPILNQICNFSSKIGSTLEYTVVGAALLLGTIGDELIKRVSESRK